MNDLTRDVFNSLKLHYTIRKAPKTSFIKQIQVVEAQIELESSVAGYKESVKKLSELFICKNQGLCDSVRGMLHEMDRRKMDDVSWGLARATLSQLLYN